MISEIEKMNSTDLMTSYDIMIEGMKDKVYYVRLEAVNCFGQSFSVLNHSFTDI